MPKTRAGTKPDEASGRAKHTPTSPTESFTLISLLGKKRTYDIVQDFHQNDSKNGFLSVPFRSIVYKARYKASVQQHGWPLIERAIERKEQDPFLGAKVEATESEVPQPSEQPFASRAYQEALEDLQLVGPVHSECPGPSEYPAQYTEAEVSQYQHEATQGRPSIQQATSLHPIHHPRKVDESGSRSSLRRSLSPVDPEIARQEIEGLLSSVNQSLEPTSKTALDSFLRESKHRFSRTVTQVSPGPTTELLENQAPVRDSIPAQIQLEGVPHKRNLQDTLRLDTTPVITDSDSLVIRGEQIERRGLRRSRTSVPPSLTSGAPSAPKTPDSRNPTSDSRRASPARPRGRPRKVQANPSFAPTQKIVTLKTSKFPTGWLLDPTTMAPVRDPSDVSNKIKDVIQNLYDVQSQTHGFVPETQGLLIDKMAELTQSLADLQRLADRTISPNNPVHNIDLAPEIVDYVDDGRNPDIFTRDFVELVQRGNAVVNGKKQAFRDFSQVYAKALKEGIGGVEKAVDLVMDNAGIGQDLEKEERHGTENGQKGRGR